MNNFKDSRCGLLNTTSLDRKLFYLKGFIPLTGVMLEVFVL